MSERAALGNAVLSLLTYLLTYLPFFLYLYLYLYPISTSISVSTSTSASVSTSTSTSTSASAFTLAPTPVWLLLPKADRGNSPIFLL